MGFSLLTQQIPSHVNLVVPPWGLYHPETGLSNQFPGNLRDVTLSWNVRSQHGQTRAFASCLVPRKDSYELL